MIAVHLGNAHAARLCGDGTLEDLPGERVTTVRAPAEWDADSVVAAVVASWGQHSRPGFAPVWIECNHSGLAELLLDRFALEPDALGRPAFWGADEVDRREGAVAEAAEPLIVEAQAAQLALDVAGRPL